MFATPRKRVCTLKLHRHMVPIFAVHIYEHNILLHMVENDRSYVTYAHTFIWTQVTFCYLILIYIFELIMEINDSVVIKILKFGI